MYSKLADCQPLCATGHVFNAAACMHECPPSLVHILCIYSVVQAEAVAASGIVSIYTTKIIRSDRNVSVRPCVRACVHASC